MKLLRVLTIPLLMVVLIGCAATGPTPSTSVVSKNGTGQVRQDTAPLVERFPQLASLTDANWMSGTLGDGRTPGPSLYWIDAIVVLPQADFDALRGRYEYDTASAAPAVDGPLVVLLPVGVLVVSGELDAEFSQGEFRSQVYLSDATHSLVLTAIFE